MVGTAQERLCPPYETGAVILRCEPSNGSSFAGPMTGFWRASKDGYDKGACGPSFEARKGAHLRMTGCERANIPTIVVPAKAGTHNHRRCGYTKVVEQRRLKRGAAAYGSPREPVYRARRRRDPVAGTTLRDAYCFRRRGAAAAGSAGAATAAASPSSRQREDLHRQHRMIEALELQIIQRGGIDPWLDDAVDAPGNHDLAGLGFVAESATQDW